MKMAKDLLPNHLNDLSNIEAGRLTLYQFYDVGYAIDLDQAQSRLTEAAARRHRPVQTRQASSVQVAQPPLHVDLGTMSVSLGDQTLVGAVHASVYDLGVIVLALEASLPASTSWDTAADMLGTWQDPPADLEDRFLTALDEFEKLIRPAITRPARGAIVEDYCILTVDRLATPMTVADLAEHPLVIAALLGERRALSAGANRLVTSVSYYPDDVVLLSWNGALIVDPDPLAVATTANLIEFANVELLLMRAYDTQIDAELPRVYRGIQAGRGRFTMPLVRRYSLLLQDVQQLVVEVTEITERVDNALKVTDDIYWGRLYSAVLHVLRVEVWRQGVNHKLDILRETYRMLHEDADAERASALEWIIILLIVFEIVMAFWGRL